MDAPAVFGRGRIVASRASGGDGAVVVIDEAVLADPEAAVETLHRHWLSRTPVCVVLEADPARFREPLSYPTEPYTLTPAFTPLLDRLHFLVWNNNVDARGETPVWWWARKAAALGARPCEDGAGDVLLPDGTVAWIDGGPRDGLIPPGTAVVHSETVEAGRLTPVPAAREPHADLAPDQLAAVAHRGGAARIIAPAGSGKTRVLTERLRHLLATRGYESESVVALAYNRRAREEMAARSSDVAGRIQTLNAMAYEVLRDVRPGVRTLDERRVRTMLETLLPPLQWRSNTDPIAPYIEALTTIRLGMRQPHDVEAAGEGIDGVAAAFPAYRDAMLRENAIDFDEQLYAAVEALLRNGALRRRWQQRTRHLLVDEFQDLRPLHLLFIKLIASPQLDVFGVGDDDQVLYGYDGATPRFLIDFGRHFPGAAEHALAVNYRSPRAITDAARTLLGHNRVRIEKEIHSGPQAAADENALEVRHHPDGGAVAEVAEAVRRAMDEGARPGDIAVLARVNSALLVPQIALRQEGIPLRSLLGEELLERTGTASALAYLRIATAPQAIAAADISAILRRPSRGLPPWFSERVQRRRSWTVEALAAQQMPEKDAAKLVRLIEDLRLLRETARRGTTVAVLRAARNTIGLGGAVALLGRNKGADRSSHLDDLDALESIASLHPDAASFEQWLRGLLRQESDGEGVTLATVHSVKGMEWDHIVVIGADDGLMPHRQAEDAEEERRIFHVAITRARRRAVVIASGERPSPFLRELRTPWRPSEATAPAPGSAHHGSDEIAPEVGMALIASGGIAGTVARISGTGIALALGPGSNLTVRYGEWVTHEGRRARLRAPARRAAGGGPATPLPEGPMSEALRAWRLATAREEGIAAFMVMANTTLAAIATSRPATRNELARVPGIGPTKLERYGDAILALVAAAE